MWSTAPGPDYGTSSKSGTGDMRWEAATLPHASANGVSVVPAQVVVWQQIHAGRRPAQLGRAPQATSGTRGWAGLPGRPVVRAAADLHRQSPSSLVEPPPSQDRRDGIVLLLPERGRPLSVTRRDRSGGPRWPVEVDLRVRQQLLLWSGPVTGHRPHRDRPRRRAGDGRSRCGRSCQGYDRGEVARRRLGVNTTRILPSAQAVFMRCAAQGGSWPACAGRAITPDTSARPRTTAACPISPR